MHLRRILLAAAGLVAVPAAAALAAGLADPLGTARALLRRTRY